MAEESHDNYSNFDPAFGLERSEDENQNEPKSKPTNENNSAEERRVQREETICRGRKQRSLLTALRERRTLGTKNGFRWLRCQ